MQKFYAVYFIDAERYHIRDIAELFTTIGIRIVSVIRRLEYQRLKIGVKVVIETTLTDEESFETYWNTEKKAHVEKRNGEDEGHERRARHGNIFSDTYTEENPGYLAALWRGKAARFKNFFRKHSEFCYWATQASSREGRTRCQGCAEGWSKTNTF